jgi:hypothetical protein
MCRLKLLTLSFNYIYCINITDVSFWRLLMMQDWVLIMDIAFIFFDYYILKGSDDGV